MADITLENLLTVGTGGATFVSPAVGGDRASNPRSRTRIWVDNTGAAKNLTITSQAESEFGPYPDLVLPIPAATFYAVPAFSAQRFNTADGFIEFQFDSTTGVTIAAVEDEFILKDPP